MKHKKTSRLLAAGMTIVVLLTACGEKGNTGGGGSVNSGSSANETQKQPLGEETHTNKSDESLVAEVAENKDKLDGSIKVTKKIKWMSWYDIDETQPPSELFKLQYGVPEPEKSDKIFEYIHVNYNTRYKELAKQIASGSPPDMFPFEIRNYNYNIFQNLFVPADEIIDIDNSLFDDYRAETEKLMVKGHIYAPVTYVENATMLWYRRSIAEENGLDDPYDLYKKGKWNWDSFLKMCRKFSDSDNGIYAVDGFAFPSDFLVTTGVPLVDLVDGNLKDNLDSKSVERAMDVLKKMEQSNYRYPRQDNEYNVNIPNWVAGKTLFFADGLYAFEERWAEYIKSNGWDSDDVMFVPYPKDPKSDKYYQAGQPISLMFCKGSQNINGYTAFVECWLATNVKGSLSDAYKEKQKKDYGWTDEQLDLQDDLRLNMNHVFDFKNSLGEDISSATDHNNPIESLTVIPFLTGVSSYTQLRAENEAQIRKRIDELNK